MRKNFLLVTLSVILLLFSVCSKSTDKETAVSIKVGTITQKEIKGADSAIQQMVIERVYDNMYGEKYLRRILSKSLIKLKNKLKKHSIIN